MTDKRKEELFDGMLEWIYEHTESYGICEYIGALEHCGFTEDEIRENFLDFLDVEEVDEAFKNYEEGNY